MEGWHPRASRVPATRDGGTWADGYPWRQVIHTTEVAAYNASTTSYYGHASWPHCTIHAGRIYQHISITRAARALKNTAGGVETNRARAVQVEVAWKAADIHRLPADQRAALADWLTWVHEQTGCPLTGPVFVGAEQRPAGVRAAQRMSPAEWKSFAGTCGHQHVPENDHWDPGALNLPAVLAFARPDTKREDDVPAPTDIVAAVSAGPLGIDTRAHYKLRADGTVEVHGGVDYGDYQRLKPEHRRGDRYFVDLIVDAEGYTLYANDRTDWRFDPTTKPLLVGGTP